MEEGEQGTQCPEGYQLGLSLCLWPWHRCIPLAQRKGPIPVGSGPSGLSCPVFPGLAAPSFLAKVRGPSLAAPSGTGPWAFLQAWCVPGFGSLFRVK